MKNIQPRNFRKIEKIFREIEKLFQKLYAFQSIGPFQVKVDTQIIFALKSAIHFGSLPKNERGATAVRNISNGVDGEPLFGMFPVQGELVQWGRETQRGKGEIRTGFDQLNRRKWGDDTFFFFSFLTLSFYPLRLCTRVLSFLPLQIVLRGLR